MSDRACGTCSLCCKTMDVAALSKPAGAWCKHCTPGRGCGTYQLRPKQCRDFECGWLLDPSLGPEWKPEIAKFVIAYEYDARCISIMVDPNQPNAWRSEPYYSVLKRLTIAQMSKGKIVMIVDPAKRTLLLPDGEAPLGDRHERFDWTITRSEKADGPHFDIEMTRLGQAQAA